MKKKKIVVLTGAGISAESGIKTFRDAGGLWEGYDIEDVATPNAWQKNPPLVLDFYNQRRKEVRNAQPNAAHKALVVLEEKYKVVIITQNIDDLHERAGSSTILHLHGEIMQARSSRDAKLYPLGDKDIHIGDVDEYGIQLRPFVVWFGEAVPMMDKAIYEVMNADYLIIIGTSLAVYPAAGLITYASQEAQKYIIDPNIPEVQSIRNLHKIKATATIGVQKLVKELMKD